MKPILPVLTLLTAVALGGLKADTINDLTSRAGFTDSLDWGQLGPCSSVPEPVPAVSAGGIHLTASASGSSFAITRQTTPGDTGGCAAGVFHGDFNPLDNLLWTDGGSIGPVTLTFGQDIAAIGFQIQSVVDAGSPYTAELDAYNGATLLGKDIASGFSTANADNSAVFLGLSDLSGANITSVVISLTAGPGNLSDFAINQLSLDTVTPAPEPSSVGITLVLVLGMVALVHRRKKMLQRCD